MHNTSSTYTSKNNSRFFDLKTDNSLRLAVLLVFICGCIFVLSFLFDIFVYGLEIFFTDIQKITVQSNLLSFILTGVYLKWPHLSIFKTNTVFIVVGTILITAGIGFFCFLLPFHLINN